MVWLSVSLSSSCILFWVLTANPLSDHKWTSLNKHRAPLPLRALTPIHVYQNLKLTWLLLMGPSPFVHIKSCHWAVTKKRCHCLLLLKDLQSKSWGLTMWSFGYQVNAPMWHQPGHRGFAEVVWSLLKTCVAQGAKAFIAVVLCQWLLNLFLGVKLDLQNIPFSVDMSV